MIDSVKIPTGIFGGSFDPPHFGHAGILRSFFLEFPECKEVFIVPNLQNPLKGEKNSSPETILEMLHIFVSDFEENISILDLELKREGPSYTIRTLEELRSSYPEREFYLLIGEDNYSNFHEWKDWKKILDSVKTVCVFRRTSETIPENPDLRAVSSKFSFLKNPLLPVSSTELRREFKISARETSGVPANLRDYIEKKGLYQT